MPSSVPPPRPRPSAAVYRRRRIVVAVLAAALLLLVGWGLGLLVNAALGSRGDDAEPSPSASPTPVSSPTPAQESSADGGAEADSADVPECAPLDLRVVAATDKDEYERGAEAVLRLDVTNLSGAPCRTDVGTAVQEFRLEDAEGEQVMSTRVCQAEPGHEEIVLAPRDRKSSVYRWGGRASSADCTKEGPLVEAGAYRFTVTLGEVTSREITLTVTEKEGAAESSGASRSASAEASPSGRASQGASPSGSETSRSASADDAGASSSGASSSPRG